MMIEKVEESVTDTAKQQKGRKREMDKLKHYKVFRRIMRKLLPKGKKAISVQWYEKMKNDECRSRLCVRDIAPSISQEYFAAAPSQSSLRLLLPLAHALGLEVQSADLDTAFMHAPLEETEYAEAPDEDKNDPTHEMYGQDYVWVLDKAMNGLRGAPKAYRAWFRDQMVKIGMKPISADQQVFKHPTKMLFVDVHVDDPLAIGSKEDLEWLWAQLGPLMTLRLNPILKMNESMKHLGFVYTKTTKGFTVKIQDGYVDEVLEAAQMQGCKGLNIPGLGAPTKDDSATMEFEVSTEEHEMIRRVTGQLQFLANKRDDLLYPTKEVAKDLAKPTQYILKKMKKLVRYLQGTRDVVHVVSMNDINEEIEVHVDASWVNDPVTRRHYVGGDPLRRHADCIDLPDPEDGGLELRRGGVCGFGCRNYRGGVCAPKSGGDAGPEDRDPGVHGQHGGHGYGEETRSRQSPTHGHQGAVCARGGTVQGGVLGKG